MRIKSYFVKSVDEAIAQARKDLGEDALLLNTRKGSSVDGSWTGYEVVFGCAEDPAEDQTPATVRPAGVRMAEAAPAVRISPAAAVSEIGAAAAAVKASAAAAMAAARGASPAQASANAKSLQPSPQSTLQSTLQTTSAMPAVTPNRAVPAAKLSPAPVVESLAIATFTETGAVVPAAPATLLSAPATAVNAVAVNGQSSTDVAPPTGAMLVAEDAHPASLSALIHRSRAVLNVEAPELEQLRAQMDEIHGLLLSSGSQRAFSRGLPFLDGVFARLTKAGWSEALAGSILEAVVAAMPPEAAASRRKSPISIGRRPKPEERLRMEELLRTQLAARVKIDAALGVPGSHGTVVAMVGPSGSGKTSLLMKIAAFQADPSRPVRLLSLDRSGLGGRMHLQMFAHKTRIGFTSVESPEALPQLIQEARQTEIVLVDTPGYLPPLERGKVAAALSRCPGVDVHLVLPAYMTSSACREAIQRFAPFAPAKLAVTRFDETASFGTLVPEAAAAGLSLSLVTDGVSIPDSLHAFSLEDLMIMALGPESAEAACA